MTSSSYAAASLEAVQWPWRRRPWWRPRRTAALNRAPNWRESTNCRSIIVKIICRLSGWLPGWLAGWLAGLAEVDRRAPIYEKCNSGGVCSIKLPLRLFAMANVFLCLGWRKKENTEWPLDGLMNECSGAPTISWPILMMIATVWRPTKRTTWLPVCSGGLDTPARISNPVEG